MIFHDKVHLKMSVPFDPPREDSLGNEIYNTVDQDVPAEVYPLDTDAVLGTTNLVTSRYRMILAPTVDIPPKIGTALRISWGPFQLVSGQPSSGLFVDGTVERHMVRGRLHHYEAITKSVMG